MTTSTLKERLYAKLPERPEGGCWEFTGARTSAGYGKIFLRTEGRVATGRRTILIDAHRASWEVHHGPIPPGAYVCHHCDNKVCCNPAHLFLGDQAANMQDKSAKGRAKPGPCSAPAWWTPERKAVRATQIAERHRVDRERKQGIAGVSVDTKFCPTCARWLDLDEFGRNRARDDGLQAHCKVCKGAAELARQRKKRALR